MAILYYYSGNITRFERAILLIRNPYASIWSEFQVFLVVHLEYYIENILYILILKYALSLFFYVCFYSFIVFYVSDCLFGGSMIVCLVVV